MTVKFKNAAAQGDVYIRRIGILPPEALPVKEEGGVFVVAHSRKGHHHVIPAVEGVSYYSSPNTFVSYLRVLDGPATMKHQGTHHKHKDISIGEGVFELRLQRESTVEGWRRVED